MTKGLEAHHSEEEAGAFRQGRKAEALESLLAERVEVGAGWGAQEGWGHWLH